jgi:PRTRC genetic system protein E
MNFFQELAKLLGGNAMVITAQGGDQHMTLSILPKSTKDKVECKIVPLIMNGTPVELDQGFFSAISIPINGAMEALNNIEAFNKSVAESIKRPEKVPPKKVEVSTSKQKEPPKQEVEKEIKNEDTSQIKMF